MSARRERKDKTESSASQILPRLPRGHPSWKLPGFILKPIDVTVQDFVNTLGSFTMLPPEASLWTS